MQTVEELFVISMKKYEKLPSRKEIKDTLNKFW